MSLTIRTATVTDLPLLNQLYADMDNEPPLPDGQIAALFTAMQAVANYSIYLAELNGDVVGTFSLLVLPTMMHRGYHKFAVLDAVTVFSQCREQGIGQIMMRAALKLAQDAGCYKITLSSNLKRDRAHQFYERLGFQQHGWSFSLIMGHS